MSTKCLFSEITKRDFTSDNCETCIKKYEMPYRWCCLDKCGELTQCAVCEKGIHLLGEEGGEDDEVVEE